MAKVFNRVSMIDLQDLGHLDWKGLSACVCEKERERERERVRNIHQKNISIILYLPITAPTITTKLRSRLSRNLRHGPVRSGMKWE